MNLRKFFVSLSALLAAALMSGAVYADEAEDTGAGPYSAAVNHDFKVVVDSFLYFKLGTAAPGTVDEIVFNVTGSNAGSGNAVAGTGGSEGGGVAAVEVRSNAGQVTITEGANATGLTSATTSDSIDFAEIAVSTDDANIPAITLSNAGGNTSTPVLNGASNNTLRKANWTFSYLNNTVVQAGTYGGSAQGGRKTFTASAP